MERSAAVDRVLGLLDTIEEEPMPVPITEVWVFGELALGLDPLSRIDVYLAKDMLFAAESASNRGDELSERYGVEGIGRTVSTTWADTYPEYVRANDAGYAAPERCLAAHLIEDDEPIHLEICNAGFESNVTQRLEGARARDDYESILDPRGVCLWAQGERSETAPDKLRDGEYVFPTLPEALEMLGLSTEEAERGATAVQSWRDEREGATVRGDVV